MNAPGNKVLGAALDGPLNRLVWLCEGLLQVHPDSRPHKQMYSIAKGARRLAMAGELGLAVQALDNLMEYAPEEDTEDAVAQRTSLRRRIEQARSPMLHRLRVEVGESR